MGISHSVAELSGKLDKLSKALADTRPALNATGMAGKRIFADHATRAGVLGSTIAGKRKAIGVRYDLNNRRSGLAQGSLVITYTGPAHLVNNPTKAHLIQPRLRAGSRRRRGARALRIGGNLRAIASHPGTAGKGFYQRALAQAERELPGVLGRHLITEPLKKLFG